MIFSEYPQIIEELTSKRLNWFLDDHAHFAEEIFLNLGGSVDCDGDDFCVLETGEMVTAVTLPPTSKRSIFLKYTPRKGMDFSLGAISASGDVDGDQVSNLKIVLGSVSSSPIILKEPVQLLQREGLSDAVIGKAVKLVRGELGELTNLYGRAGYKKQIARSLLQRAVTQLREL